MTDPLGRPLGRRSGRLSLIVVLIEIPIFIPLVFDDAGGSALYVAPVAGAIAVVVECMRRGRNAAVGVGLSALAMAVWVPAVLLFANRLRGEGFIYSPGTVVMFALILPGAAIAGMLAVRWSSIQHYVRAFVMLSLINVPFAVYESVSGSRLFEAVKSSSLSRAEVGQEHPIVLGMIFSVAIAGLTGQKLLIRWVGCSVLLLGIVATGSVGPLVAGVGCAVLVLASNVREFLAVHRRFAVSLLVTVAVVLTFLALRVWSTYVNDYDSSSYSNFYRSALYALLPSILHNAPLGYGLNGLPPGAYFLYSNWLGPVDIASSLDSEIVFLGAEFGIVGVSMYFVVSLLGVRALLPGAGVASALIAVQVNGLTVALHAWPSFALVWFFLVGACVAAIRLNRSPVNVDSVIRLQRTSAWSRR